MPLLSQQDQLLAIDTPLEHDALLLVRFSGTEGISELFQFDLEFYADLETEVPFDKLLGEEVTVWLNIDAKTRRPFHGILNSLEECDEEEGSLLAGLKSYRATMVPRFWLQTLNQVCRVFENLTVLGICKEVLAGLEVDYTQIQQMPLRPRKLCVQYLESDFTFISRLLEAEGISYYFKHEQDKHTLVLFSDSSKTPKREGGPIPFHTHRAEPKSIHTWNKKQTLRPGKVTVNDYCFQMPEVNWSASVQVKDKVDIGPMQHSYRQANNEKLEVVWSGEGYSVRCDAVSRQGDVNTDPLKDYRTMNDSLARVRAEQLLADAIRITGKASDLTLATGHRFELSQHPTANGTYLLTRLKHEADLGSTEFRKLDRQVERKYQVEFCCVPAEIPYRAPRQTPRPRLMFRFLDLLVEEETNLGDTVDFLAHCLPRQACVWWGCLCLEHHWHGKQLTSHEIRALQAAVAWVIELSDARWNAAKELALAAGCNRKPGTSAGNLAAAAFVSDGTPLPGWGPIAPQPAQYSARHVALSIHIGGMNQAGPAEMIHYYQTCVAIGLGIGLTKHLWNEPLQKLKSKLAPPVRR